MLLKLPFDFAPLQNPLSYKSGITLVGSCFAEHIGNKLLQHRFRVAINPHGIVFNPLSIAQSLNDCLNEKKYSQTELIQSNDLWHSFNHHGSFSDVNADIVLENINSRIAGFHKELQQSSHLIFTFGSAWVYELRETKNIVANCHKMSATLFEKRLLAVNEIVENYSALFQHQTLKSKSIILSVSPVRYVRDGLIENNLSKAVLLQAVQELKKLFSNVQYFPSYEIVIDELRDYRFFEKDLVHPNALAIDYVWQRFAETSMNNETQQFVKDMEQLNAMLAHKPLHKGTSEYEKFTESTQKKTDEMKIKYAEIEF